MIIDMVIAQIDWLSILSTVATIALIVASFIVSILPIALSLG